jgi:hypothetical protein
MPTIGQYVRRACGNVEGRKCSMTRSGAQSMTNEGVISAYPLKSPCQPLHHFDNNFHLRTQSCSVTCSTFHGTSLYPALHDSICS